MAVNPATVTIVDDSDTSIVSFSPADAWSVPQDAQYDAFYKSTYHVSTLRGAAITFTFTGTSVAYYSDKNNDHGDFTVSIDDSAPVTASSYASAWSAAPMLLYESPPLSPGVHTLVITNVKNDTALGLDSFVVRPEDAGGSTPISGFLSPTSSVDGAVMTTAIGNSTVGKDDKGASTGTSHAAVYIVAGFLIGVAVCCVVAFFIRYLRRRTRQALNSLPQHQPDFGPAPQHHHERPLPHTPRNQPRHRAEGAPQHDPAHPPNHKPKHPPHEMSELPPQHKPKRPPQRKPPPH